VLSFTRSDHPFISPEIVMKSRNSILILSFLITVCCLASFSQDSKKQDQYGKWEPMVQMVQDILAGKNPDKRAIIISPSAYLVSGKHFESLQGVINGENKECSLNEGALRSAVWLHLKVNDPENAAFLILRTQTEKKTDDRFHTVVFMKDSGGQWSIQSWHTSQ
jgi:hypothetical protein